MNQFGLESPFGYLQTFGARADPATALTWGLIALSLAVSAVIAALVLVGVLVRRRKGTVASLAAEPAVRGADGLMWFYIGMPLTILALLGALIWTVLVLAWIDSPSARPRVTIEVTGHQWWWEARYLSGGASVVTANEIHIPTGQPVLIRLLSGDVIHSFWIPKLSGKTDAIPGQTNLSWLQTDRPGLYLGQCAEYCGLQHAHMALRVIAQTPAAFDAWREAQSQPAGPPPDAKATDGQAVFSAHCGACHEVRGAAGGAHPDAATAAAAAPGGIPGPDLTHLISRATLAAGAVANTTGGLSGWIANPQALKPGTRMPATNLSGPQLGATVAYLETLQ